MTSAQNPKTIILAGGGVRREGVAGGTITPGMLISGPDSALVPHGDAGNLAQAAFALEYDLTGRSITDDYSAGDQVLYSVLKEGSEVYAILADGEDVSKGDPLASNGDGKLAAAAATNFVVARALEDKTASGEDERIRVVIERGTLQA